MKSEAIRYAIKLNAEPAMLACFSDPQRKLPRGVTELLRIVSSDAALKQVSIKNNIDAKRFRKILLNYIQKILLQKDNSDLRTLGLDQSADSSLRRLHYRLLMNVFHPDKLGHDPVPHQFTQLISKAYKNTKNEQVLHSHKRPITSKFSVSASMKDSQHIKGFKRFFVANNNDVFVRNNWIAPVFGLSLISVLIMLFVLTPSSPQMVVKKTSDSLIQEIASQEINLREEERRSTVLSIRDQQHLSKN